MFLIFSVIIVKGEEKLVLLFFDLKQKFSYFACKAFDFNYFFLLNHQNELSLNKHSFVNSYLKMHTLK